MKKFYLLSVLLLIIAKATIAQVSITNLATPYTQDFNTLDAAATTTPSNVLPLGWEIFETGTSSLVDQKYKADNGILNSGDTYAYGVTAATERALGSIQSGTNFPTYGVKFVNNTTSAISSITVSYVGEQWRLATVSRKDTLAFQYSIGNSTLSDNTNAWTTISQLEFTSPNTTTINALDGNAVGNKTTITFTIFGLNIAPNTAFHFKWLDKNISGSDDGLSIDDVTINFSGTAAVACTEPVLAATSLTLTPATTSISGSFTASATANQYLVIQSLSATLTAAPVDATSYTVGSTLGGGTVISNGTTTTFNATGLNTTTQYYYFIYTANSGTCTGGPNYLSNSLNGNTTTTALPNCITPTTGATNLILTPTATQISGSFTLSSTANYYIVVRSTTPTLSANPMNGTIYTVGQTIGGGNVIQAGTTNSFNASGLTANTQYYFHVYAANTGCTGAPTYLSTALIGNTTTLISGATSYYSGTVGLTCAALKTKLYQIISSGTTVLSYTPGVWNAYQTTDLVRNFENTRDIIYDMYSNKGPGVNEPYEYVYQTNQCGNYSAESDCYNREHSMPQSWFNQASPMVTDIHHVVPSDGYVNNKRGNDPFGEVGTATYTSQNGSKSGNSNFGGYTGIVFEPINVFKGDFARTQLYMAVRYENLIASWEPNAAMAFNGTNYQCFDDWYLKLLYKWHTNDVVSNKEILRNDAVFAIQGNRNPFIDSAQFALKIWSCTGLLGSTTAINEPNLKDNKFFITKNTGNSIAFLRLEKGLNQKSFVNIYDIAGRFITQVQIPARSIQIPLSTATFGKGIYIAKLKGNDGVATAKFLND